MEELIVIGLVALAVIVMSCWWRYRSLACPAGLSWLVDNPYMNTVAGADTVIGRMNLDSGMKVLDIGSGTGRLSIPIARQVGNTGEVVALDIQAKMLKKLKSNARTKGIKNIRIIEAGAGAGKVDADYFDRALMVTVLGEIRDKHRALLEIYKALKQGGILSITEVIPDPHYTTRDKVRLLCNDVGFEEVEEFGSWAAFTINFKKSVGAEQIFRDSFS